tara:strand:+ start:104 stop:322 length:219 start_codon:yes stop_codon:yes gene_type:complete
MKINAHQVKVIVVILLMIMYAMQTAEVMILTAWKSVATAGMMESALKMNVKALDAKNAAHGAAFLFAMALTE